MIGYRHNLTGSRIARRLGLLCLSAAVLAGFSSCDKVIYDYEGDCSVHYMVRFRYDYNMKWADAFAHEVEGVTLYLIDADGNIVLEQSEEGPALEQEGYEMEVKVDPGRYSLLAWCGTKDNGSFTVPQTSLGTGLTCTLGTKTDADGGLYVDDPIDRLYYGYLADQEFTGTEGTHTYTLPLVKDTNEIQVVLQHTSGSFVDPSDFVFTITSDNRAMDWDNSLIADGDLTYYAFYTDSAEADFDLSGTKSGERLEATFTAALAEFTISRLVQGHDTRLTVYNSSTGETVISIPLIDILVMVKGYYNQSMSDQEFLDRQDEYDLVFFLDEGNRWIDTYIYINSWKIVLQNTGL